MDDIDRRIINQLQDGFPICPSPYQVVAESLDITADELIRRLQSLLDDGVLSRFGPMYHAEHLGGALTLAALAVPEERFEHITELVNAHPEVAHNYARQHTLNMWFVLATEKPEQVAAVIEQIEQETDLRVFNMPKIEEYFVELKLEA